MVGDPDRAARTEADRIAAEGTRDEAVEDTEVDGEKVVFFALQAKFA
jgi:hypothetical protein